MNTFEKNHYTGILAQWYDKLLENEQNDIAFYKQIVSGCEGKILELACGTGRLLVPYLQFGADIEGLDISDDMLAVCRKKLKRKNLSTNLYCQNLINFKIEDTFDLIFISGGSFQLVDNFDSAMSSLACIFGHLNSGGRFVLDLFPLWAETGSNGDEDWKPGRTACNKQGETFACSSCIKMDPINQVQKGRFKYEILREGCVVTSLIDDLDLRWYGKHEFKLMLEKVGFTDIQMEIVPIMSTHGESVVYHAKRSVSLP